MPATRSTTKWHRETQNSRQIVARQDRSDYYKCGRCGGLYSRYHNMYKRHIQVCEARGQKQREEMNQTLVERCTPTPEPYIQASGSEEVESELGADFGMETVMNYGAPAFQGSYTSVRVLSSSR